MSEAKEPYQVRRKAEKPTSYKEAWALYVEKYKDSLDFPPASDEQFTEALQLMELRRNEAFKQYVDKEAK